MSDYIGRWCPSLVHCSSFDLVLSTQFSRSNSALQFLLQVELSFHQVTFEMCTSTIGSLFPALHNHNAKFSSQLMQAHHLYLYRRWILEFPCRKHGWICEQREGVDLNGKEPNSTAGSGSSLGF